MTARGVYADWLEENAPGEYDPSVLEVLRSHPGEVILDRDPETGTVLVDTHPEPDSPDHLWVDWNQGVGEDGHTFGYVGHREPERGGFFFPSGDGEWDPDFTTLLPDEMAPPRLRRESGPRSPETGV